MIMKTALTTTDDAYDHANGEDDDTKALRNDEEGAESRSSNIDLAPSFKVGAATPLLKLSSS